MSTVLERKIKKVLELRVDSNSLLTSLDAVSQFLDKQASSGISSSSGGTSGARKSLRDDLEQQNAALSICFLKSIERLKARVSDVESEADGLEAGCKSVFSRLLTAEADMRQFTERAQTLRRQKDSLTTRAEQVTLFLQKFQLSKEEIDALGGSSGPSHHAAASVYGSSSVLDTQEGRAAFFAALSRLKSVHRECSRLVGSQSAGFDLLDALSQHLEAAYERLYHWVQARCEQQLGSPRMDENSSSSEGHGSLLDTSAPQADVGLQTAVRALQDRPVYFTHCQVRFNCRH